MKEVQAVLLDLDGTLIDSREFIYRAFEHTLSFHGFSVLDRVKMAPYIGRPILGIYQEIAPGCDVETLFDTHAGFQQQNMHLLKPFPDTAEVLGKLRQLGIKLGVVTSRLKNTSEVLTAVGLSGVFDVTITGNDITHQKPHPESITKALDVLGVTPTKAWVVGDADVDILAGKNAGVLKTVGVTYGFGGENIRDAKPDYVIDDIKELLDLMI